MYGRVRSQGAALEHGTFCSLLCTLPNFHVESSFSHTTYDFFLNKQPHAPIIQIYCYKTLHVSGILSDHHLAFSIVHSALLSFMQVSDARFQAESGWNRINLDNQCVLLVI
jgi:hypothetical protein